MKKFGIVFKVIVAILVLLILGLWVYVESHQPKLRGTVNMQHLVKNVEVYYDDFGIPHIYASGAEDAYRTFGYVHAADRLFQMELMRRVGAGRLAEIFGSDLKKTDMFFRTLGTNRKAKTDAGKFNELPDRVKAACTSYIAGVNDYIRNGKIPIEYKLLRIEPEPYTVEDMYCIAGYMAYSFAYALRTDPLVEKINNRLGPQYFRDFDMAYPADSLWSDPDSSSTDENYTIGEILKDVQSVPFLDQLPVPVLQGSNNWVLSPARTLSGKVMLVNDTHIKYASPSVWYEAHIEYPGFANYGNYLAGIPVALIGHSRNHAWGITMFEDDDSDFFREQFLSSDSSATSVDSAAVPVIKFKETISVKGEGDTTITVYETVHGPIINNFMPVKFKEPVSMYWNYTAIPNQLIEAFFQMNTAINMEIFKEGVEKVGSPGLNIAYGDAAGNIGLWSASKLIKRPEGEYGKLFLSGETEPYQNYAPFSQNPQSENPENGYLFSANQRHVSKNKDSYPGYYAPNTRYDRIEKKLRKMKPATVDSMKALLNDNYSKTAASIAHEMSAVISRSGLTLSSSEKEALKYLKDWDGNHTLENNEPTIYYKVLFYTLRKTMIDEIGEDIFNSLLSTHLLMRTYPKLLFNDQSKWWDNVKTTGKIEKRAEVFTDAFKKSIAELRDDLGDDMSEWRWERVHTTTHEHPIGKIDILRPFFNVGPFPSPGGIETINNAGFTLNGSGEYHSNFGPAMRIIVDFGDVDNALSVLPTGNSGNPLSKHYNDQAEMYIEGLFRKMMMNKKEIVSKSTLVEFKPES